MDVVIPFCNKQECNTNVTSRSARVKSGVFDIPKLNYTVILQTPASRFAPPKCARRVAAVCLSAPNCKPALQSCKTYPHHPSGPLLTTRKACDDEMQGGASKCAQVDSYSLTVCVASLRSVVLHPVASLHLQLENRTVITLQDLCFLQERLIANPKTSV